MAATKLSLSVQKFESLYESMKDELVISDFSIMDSSFFNDAGKYFKKIRFNRCRFFKDFELTSAFRASKLSFVDCEFEGDLVFEKITKLGQQKDDPINDPALSIKNCNVKGILGLGIKMDGSILIENCELEALAAAVERANNLYVEGCKIGMMNIAAIRALQRVWISSNTIKTFTIDSFDGGNLLISNNTVGQFVLHEKAMYDKEDGRIQLGFNTFEDCKIEIGPYFNGKYDIRSNTLRNGIIMSDYISMGPVGTHSASVVSKTNPGSELLTTTGKPTIIVEVTDNIILNALTIENGLELKFLEVRLSPSNKGLLNINGAKAETLIIGGTLQGATLNVDLMNVLNVRINKFMNYGNVLLSNYTPLVPAAFSVFNSNLGALELSVVSFNNNVNVKIGESNLGDLKFSAVTWFPEGNLNKQSRPYSPSDNLRRNNHLHDIFKQLRRAAEKASDKSLTAYFRSLEHKYQLRILRKTVPFYHQERILLTLNLSNKFGTDWVRPIWLAMLVSVVGYLSIVGSFSADGNLGLNYWVAVRKYSFAIPQFLNPAHSLIAIFDYKQHPELAGKLTILPYFIDLLVRVVVSYLLVQTVIAFRKQSN